MEKEMKDLLEKTKNNYFNEIDDEETFKLFNEILEKTGDKEAKFFVGEMYYLGIGTEQNLEEAYKIMNELYSEDRRAREKIAAMYIDGIYLEQNGEKAFKIYKELVEDGKDNTGYDNYMLGICYKDGDGTKIDLEKAFNYIKKGAELGFEKSYSLLGYMYFQGEGTEINDKEAIKYLSKAVEFDNENTSMAEYILGMIYLEGKENGLEVEENKEYGLELIKRAAEKGHEGAINELKELNIN